MVSRIERRLAEFVDRDDEMSRFCAMLDSDDKAIMVVWGESGIGKSSLFLRMVHECAARSLPKAEVIWKESNPHDYLAVMRKIRDDAGAQHFGPFTDLVNYFTQEGYQPRIEVNLTLASSGQIQVGAGMAVSESRVGDIAGVLIKDSMFVLPRPDMAVPPHERRDRLTRRFLADLRGAVERLERRPLVLLLDAVEKMAPDAETWLWEQLLDAVREGELPHVKFVLCGQKKPPDDRDWRMFLEEASLQPLGEQDIARYLAKRFAAMNPGDATVLMLARTIRMATRGNPAEIAKTVDFLEEEQKAQARS